LRGRQSGSGGDAQLPISGRPRPGRARGSLVRTTAVRSPEPDVCPARTFKRRDRVCQIPPSHAVATEAVRRRFLRTLPTIVWRRVCQGLCVVYACGSVHSERRDWSRGSCAAQRLGTDWGCTEFWPRLLLTLTGAVFCCGRAGMRAWSAPTCHRRRVSCSSLWRCLVRCVDDVGHGDDVASVGWFGARRQCGLGGLVSANHSGGCLGE
jgi:hypothetical protein